MGVKLWYAAIASAFFYTLVHGDCESYGIDFQDGGVYFQNSLSTAPFTALEDFEGCQNDTAYNIMVDPQGDQTQCSNTPLLPDETPQLVTCSQWPKNQLYSGEWSLLIISNNGDGDPIAYERDFSLTVGPQQTVTIGTAPTITGSSAGTKTITPAPVSTSVTSGYIQFTVWTQSTTSITTTTVMPMSCSTKVKSSHKDPLATLVPSILGELDSIASGIIHGNLKRSEPTPLPALAKFKRSLLEARPFNAEERAEFLEARRESLQKLAKRAPDSMTITITPTPVYVQATVTVAGATITKTQKVLVWITTIVNSVTRTSTSTIKTAASGAAAYCASAGGTLV